MGKSLLLICQYCRRPHPPPRCTFCRAHPPRNRPWLNPHLHTAGSPISRNRAPSIIRSQPRSFHPLPSFHPRGPPTLADPMLPPSFARDALALLASAATTAASSPPIPSGHPASPHAAHTPPPLYTPRSSKIRCNRRCLPRDTTPPPWRTPSPPSSKSS
jgi:hypothetical protein